MRPKYERKFGHDIGMATPMELSSHTDPFAVVPGFGVYGSVEPPYADAMPVDQLMPGSGAGLGAGSGSGEGSGAGAGGFGSGFGWTGVLESTTSSRPMVSAFSSMTGPVAPSAAASSSAFCLSASKRAAWSLWAFDSLELAWDSTVSASARFASSSSSFFSCSSFWKFRSSMSFSYFAERSFVPPPRRRGTA